MFLLYGFGREACEVMKLKVGLYGVGEAEKKWWWWVLGKWVADPEPDNPESGFGVPRISVFVNGVFLLCFIIWHCLKRKKESEKYVLWL